MNRDDDAFLEMVMAYCVEYPDVVPRMSMAMSQAIRDRLGQEAEKRSKVEAALAMSLMTKTKSAKNLFADKLEEINKFGAIRYDSIISELRGQ